MGRADRGPLLGLAGWRLPVPPWDAFELAEAVGAAFLQLDLGGPGRGPAIDTPTVAAALTRAHARHPVPVTAVSLNVLNDIGLTSTDRGAPAAARAVIRRGICRAADLGGRQVLVPSFRRSAITDRDGLERTAEILRWAVDTAASEEVVVATENVLAPPSLVELLSLVGDVDLRVLVDVGNLGDAGIPVAAYCAVAPGRILEHVHVKGPDGGREPLSAGAVAGRDGLERLLGAEPGVRGLVLESDHRGSSPAVVAADLATLHEWAGGDSARPR